MSLGRKDAVLLPNHMLYYRPIHVLRGVLTLISQRVPNTRGKLLCAVFILFCVAKCTDFQCLVTLGCLILLVLDEVGLNCVHVLHSWTILTPAVLEG